MKVFEWANVWKKESKWPQPYTAEEWRDWMEANRILPFQLPEEISEASLADPSDHYKEPIEVPYGMNAAIQKFEQQYASDDNYYDHLLEFLNEELRI